MNTNDISCAIKVLIQHDDITVLDNHRYLVKALRAAIERQTELSPLDKAEISEALKNAPKELPEVQELAPITCTSL